MPIRKNGLIIKVKYDTAFPHDTAKKELDPCGHS